MIHFVSETWSILEHFGVLCGWHHFASTHIDTPIASFDLLVLVCIRGNLLGWVGVCRPDWCDGKYVLMEGFVL